MASEKEVADLKKQLKEMAAEFRAFRSKVKSGGKSRSAGDVKGQEVSGCEVHVRCHPCIAWTSI